MPHSDRKLQIYLGGSVAVTAALILLIALRSETSPAGISNYPSWAAKDAGAAYQELLQDIKNRQESLNAPREISFTVIFKAWEGDLKAYNAAKRLGYDVEAYESPEAGFEFILKTHAPASSGKCRHALEFLYSLSHKYDGVYTGYYAP